jgi:hypothetical protein
MTLHIHAQEWLSYISKVSRNVLTTKKKPSLYRKHISHYTYDRKHLIFGGGKWRRRTGARGYGLPRAGSF